MIERVITHCCPGLDTDEDRCGLNLYDRKQRLCKHCQARADGYCLHCGGDDHIEDDCHWAKLDAKGDEEYDLRKENPEMYESWDDYDLDFID